MTLATAFDVGDLKCHALEGGRQKLDGGAMFGVVPKPLWEKRIAPDELNRIPLSTRCLLVEHDAGPILIDTSIGNKEDRKFLDIYGVENGGHECATQLEDALLQAGFRTEDIKFVVNTHLHFDHAGGNTALAEAQSGSVAKVAFPNAKYVVQRGELEYARNTNERTAASYLSHNFDPVDDAGKWQLVEGEVELVPGVRLVPTPGHVPYHQSVVITHGADTACFLGDLVPTSAHVPLPWIMGYDVEPLVTLESKRALLARAEAEEWTMIFEHDPEVALGRVVRGRKSYRCEPL
ncbi:MAG: MBL fold metallo-hydrolase [Gemmatimonadales bacterium]|jgi:glyoxylase-like metal-dependent hydrolase (beta-lactamase superfamily II)